MDDKKKLVMTFTFFNDPQETIKVEGAPVLLRDAIEYYGKGLTAIIDLFLNKAKRGTLSKNNIRILRETIEYYRKGLMAIVDLFLNKTRAGLLAKNNIITKEPKAPAKETEIFGKE